MRWGVVPCCVGTAELLVGTSPHPPPAGAPSPQREGFAGSSVSVSGPGGGPLPSPGGEGGLQRLTEAGGRMRGESSLAALERQRNLSGRHLIRPLRGHLPLKGKAALCCGGLNEGGRRIIGTPPHPPQCAHWGTFPSRGRLCGELGCRCVLASVAPGVLASVAAAFLGGGPLPSHGWEGGLRRSTLPRGLYNPGKSKAQPGKIHSAACILSQTIV